jgi:hypothetical protein
MRGQAHMQAGGSCFVRSFPRPSLAPRLELVHRGLEVCQREAGVQRAPLLVVRVEETLVQEQAQLRGHGGVEIGAGLDRQLQAGQRGVAARHRNRHAHHLADLVQHEALAHHHQPHPTLPADLHDARAPATKQKRGVAGWVLRGLDAPPAAVEQKKACINVEELRALRDERRAAGAERPLLSRADLKDRM